MSVEFEINKED